MEIKLNGKELKKLLKVKYAICKDETKPILCGIHFYTKNNKLVAEAIDGYRVGKTSIDYQIDDNIEFIINNKDIKQISKHIKNDSAISITIDNKGDIKNKIDVLQNSIDDLNDEIKTTSGEDKLDLLNKQGKIFDEITALYKLVEKEVIFNIDNTIINCNSLSCDSFINIDKLAYRKYDDDIKEYQINKKELLSALKELKKNMKRQRNNLVKLNFHDNKLDMTVVGKDDNEIIMSIDCKTIEDLEIGFNINYLIDLINSFHEKELTIRTKTKIDMIEIITKDIKGILLPIRIAKI